MLIPDLSFNLPLLIVDGLAVAFVLTQRRNSSPLTILAGGLLIFLILAGGLALFVARIHGFRVFGLMRFLAQAGSIHLPLILIIISWRCRHERFLSWSAGGIASILLLGALYAYQIEPHRLEVTQFSMTSPRLQGLSRPVRILQVADIQTDRIGRYEQEVLETIVDLEPDLIFYLGDYIQVASLEEARDLTGEFSELLRKANLDPPLGSYAVQGDCERWRGWQRLFEGTGIEPLSNAWMELELPGVSVNLIALDVNRSRIGSLKDLFQGTEERDPELLDVFIGHSPDYADALMQGDQPFLAMAGHTHGGQVRLPFFGPPITYSRLDRSLASAFTRLGSGILSVSRGIGMERREAPRIRFLCRPELRVITLMPPNFERDESNEAPPPIQIASSSELGTE